jgi:hypothetical protein
MLTIALEKKKKKLVKEDRDICRLLSYITWNIFIKKT